MSRSVRSGPGAAAAAALIATLALLGVHPPGAAQAPSVRYVDDDVGCDGQRPCYPSIQAAIDAADGNDTISVAAGRYDEAALAVDKPLRFAGPGIGDAGAAPDPALHAIWAGRAAGQRGAALTVDAAGGDLANVAVTGFRFISSPVGVLLLGRRAGDPVAVPAGRPASTIDTDIAGARVANNAFWEIGDGSPESGAVVAYWTRDLLVEGNAVAGGGDGIVVVGGTGVRIHDNVVEDIAGTGIRVRGHGNGIDIARNTLRATAERGIAVRDLGGSGLAGQVSAVTIVDNSVLDAGAEGIDVAAESGGRIDHVDLVLNRVVGAGAGMGAPRGAIAIRGGGGSLSTVRIQRGTVKDTRRPAGALGAGIYAEHIATTLEIADLAVVDGAGPGAQLVDIESTWLHRNTVTGNGGGVRIVETATTMPGALSDIKLGGFPGEGNVLADNGAAALTLVNARGAGSNTHDVDATYNDWGTAYAPIIESLIQHRPDDAALGTVSYVPALGTPRVLRLAADPAQLVADGQTESSLTATLTDAAGRPAADGTVVWLGLEGGGALARPGQRSEAEEKAGPGAVQRTPEWGEFDSPAFGPFSGSGYIRTTQPGESLKWTFDGDAVLLRYGQVLIGSGVLAVRVDGRELGSFSTLGPRKTWVERVLAHGLGAGTHTLELTVQSGEVNVDLVVAGLATRGGQVVTRLRSSANLGVGRVSGLAYGADGATAATLDVPFTAGPPATLVLSVGAASLPVGSGTTQVTADVRDQQGRPVPDHTEVRFSTDRGSIAPDRVLTGSGRAAAVFNSGSETGLATLRATAGEAGAERTITLTAGPPATVELTPSARVLPANSTALADIVIAVRDAFGHPVRDGTPVQVVTSLGTLESSSLTTAGGTARARLRTGGVAGDALVQVSAGTASAQVSVTFEAQDIRLTKSAEPQTVVVPGEIVTFTLRFENVGSGSVFDLDVHDPLPAGLTSEVFNTTFFPPGPDTSRLPDNHFQVDQLRPGQVGVLTIEARIDTKPRWGPRNDIVNRATAGTAKAAERTPEDNVSTASVIVVPGAVYTVTVRGPDRLAVGGDSGKVSARVVDRYGNPTGDDVSVFFTTDLGTVNPAVVQTRNGVAESTLTTGDKSGVATVRAVSRDNRGGLAKVRFVPGPPASLALSSARLRLPVGGETAAITATLRDTFGNGVDDVLVNLSTSLGLLSVTAARTGADGTVTSTLRSGVRTGVATIRATSGALAQSHAIPFIPGLPAGIQLALDPAAIAAGARSRAVALVADEFGNPSPDVEVAFDADLGRLASRLVATGADGKAVATITGTRPGTGLVRVSAAGFSDTAQLTVVPARVYVPYTAKNRALR